jgi:hypothetical protein
LAFFLSRGIEYANKRNNMTTYRVLGAVAVVLSAACGGESGRQPAPLAQPTPVIASPGVLEKYRLTFTADPACRSFPDSIGTRTYAMDVALGSSPVATLKGAIFASPWVGFGSANVIYFRRGSDNAGKLYFADPPIVEMISPTSWLLIEGYAEGIVGGVTNVLSADATWLFCSDGTAVAGLACRAAELRCESEDHRLTMDRE